MAITRTEAEQALADISQTERRGVDARSYRASGVALTMWGAIWIAAYTATGLLPPQDWWMAWGPGDLIGSLATWWLYRNATKGNGTMAWLMVLAALCFVVALYATDPPRSARTAQALPALIVAFIYMMVGAVRLTRYSLIGGALMAATVFGFFAFPGYLAFWMAAVGGGALLLSGYWLRGA